MTQTAAFSTAPSLVDRGFQLAYKCAYRLMRAYWVVRKPKTHGALVALWNEGDVLLVRNSYVSYYSLPGGYVRRHEQGREAAVRELREEVGIHARPEQLTPAFDDTRSWEGKRDHCEIFELELSQRPSVNIDRREVIDAAWFSPERALELNLFPPLRHVIQRHAAAVAAAAAER
jgi:8-oxo-dGTP pyrophosphatase MutT (NUDIX family)